MKTTPDFTQRVLSHLESAVEYMTVSFLLALSVVLVSSSWRKNKTYFLSAVIFGTVVGFVANQTPLLESFDYLLAIIATISAPPTIAIMQHKNIFELIKDIKDLKEDKEDGEE